VTDTPLLKTIAFVGNNQEGQTWLS